MRENQELNIEWRPLDAVVPYDRNPRVIPQSAVEKVAASINKFGWRQPIVVDAAGVIIVGHTRLLAARHLRLATAPVHVAELSEDEARAYRLADNRVGEETSWATDLLGDELRMLGDAGLDLAPLGFDVEALGALGEIEPAPPARYAEQYGVIVVCAGEDEQRRIFELLTGQGLSCRVVAT